MSFIVAISTSSFDLFGDKIRFLQPSVLVMKGLQACIAWDVPPADVLSAVARSRCKQRVIFAVFKALCDDGVCRCPFPLLPFQYVFQAPVDDERSDKEDDQRTLRCNFIFFMSSCVKLFFHCTTSCFP